MRLMSLLLFNILREPSRISSTAFRLLGAARFSNYLLRVPAHNRTPFRLFTSVTHDAQLIDAPRFKIAAITSAQVEDIVGKNVKIYGWVRTLRAQKTNTFIEINDGSTLSGIQAVVDNGNPVLCQESAR